MWKKEQIREELDKLGEGYDYFLEDMMRVLEQGYIPEELIWDRQLIQFAVSKGVKNYSVAFEDELANRWL